MSRRRPAARPKKNTFPLEHSILLTATLCLLAAGAVMVYSASSARTLLEGSGDGTGYLIKYLAYGTVGFIALQIASRIDLDVVRRLTPALLGFAFFLLVLVHVPGIGVNINGATRWVGAGPVQFQPSELMKLALILYAVDLLAKRPKMVLTFRGIVSPLFVVAGAACLLILTQPDLGTSLVIGFTMCALLVAAGLPMGLLGKIAGSVSVAIMLFAVAEPYRRDRLMTFLDPWAHASDEGFQSVQGQIALGSGGLFGNGIGESVQKIFYLPEAHTDFILAVIGEELGVVGICVLLFLYGLIAYAGLRAAKMARGAYAQLLGAGITSLILCQATLNVFTVLGLAPLTGVPLPFISSGSASLMTLMASMGLLLNVANGGHSVVRAVPGSRADESRDRSRRDSRPRRTGAGSGRRAAG